MKKSFTVKGSCTVTWDEEDFLDDLDVNYDKSLAQQKLRDFHPTDEHVIQVARDMYNIHDMDCTVEKKEV